MDAANSLLVLWDECDQNSDDEVSMEHFFLLYISIVYSAILYHACAFLLVRFL